MKKKTLLSWSSGKDSAWTLKALREDPRIDLLGIFSVVNETYGRVSMHATRLDLLERQAGAAGLPFHAISIPHPCSNEECDAIMRSFIRTSQDLGIECMAFGDLYLEDVRSYRENQLTGTGITPLFPLWGIPTKILAEQMISSGLEAYISCVDPRKVPADIAGRRWSWELINELPANVDPCGENGEFHTVVTACPVFSSRIDVRVGDIVERDGFVFADIVPSASAGIR